jgi:thymidylate kinase
MAVKKKKINKKVKNATETIYDGIKFRSKLEVYCYQQLMKENIQFEYENKTFVLIDKFVFNNTSYELGRNKVFSVISPNVRPMTYTPDFVGKDWIIEVKGRANDALILY